VAFSVATDGNGLDFTKATLWTADFEASGPRFVNVHKILSADDVRPTLTYPSFTPDSKWIAYQRSTQSRLRNSQSDVWLTDVEGSSPVPLDSVDIGAAGA